MLPPAPSVVTTASMLAATSSTALTLWRVHRRSLLFGSQKVQFTCLLPDVCEVNQAYKWASISCWGAFMDRFPAVLPCLIASQLPRLCTNNGIAAAGLCEFSPTMAPWIFE